VFVERVARNAGVSQYVVEAKLVSVLFQEQGLSGIEQLDPNSLAAGLFGLLLAQRHHVELFRTLLWHQANITRFAMGRSMLWPLSLD